VAAIDASSSRVSQWASRVATKSDAADATDASGVSAIALAAKRTLPTTTIARMAVEDRRRRGKKKTRIPKGRGLESSRR